MFAEGRPGSPALGEDSGVTLVLGDQDVGTIASIDTAAPRWTSGGLYSRPMLSVNGPLAGVSSTERRARISYTPTTEIFVSAWVRIDAPMDSFGASWKLFWIADGPDGFGGSGDGTDKYDVVMLTKASSLITRFSFAGNESGGNVLETGNGWLTDSQWFHFSGWLKDNGASELGVLCQIMTAGTTALRKTAPSSAGQTMLNNSISSTISRLNVMGDSNNSAGGDQVPTFIDHLTITVGSNARSRVEIGNAESYDNCTELFPCTVSSWGSTITATVRHPSPSSKYIHIHDGDGNHTNGGIGRLVS